MKKESARQFDTDLIKASELPDITRRLVWRK